MVQMYIEMQGNIRQLQTLLHYLTSTAKDNSPKVKIIASLCNVSLFTIRNAHWLNESKKKRCEQEKRMKIKSKMSFWSLQMNLNEGTFEKDYMRIESGGKTKMHVCCEFLNSKEG